MIALVWAAAKPWLKSLNVWALVALLGLCVAIYWGSIIKEHRRQEAAKAASEAATSAAAVEAAAATAAAQRQAEAETTLPSTKAEILARCKAAASCRERGRK